MRQAWFWGTFVFWILLGFGVSWALIESPSGVTFKSLGKFEGEVNGYPQKHQLEVGRGLLADGWEKTTRRCEKEGWRSLAGSFDLFSIFLGLPSNPSPFSPYTQAGLFQKADHIKLCSLWNDKDQTYRWTIEFPKKSYEKPDLNSIKDLPLRPADDAFNFFQGAAGDLQMASWSLPVHPDFSSRFVHDCSSQGFNCESVPQGRQEPVFLLHKGRFKLTAILSHHAEADQVTISFMPSEETF